MIRDLSLAEYNKVSRYKGQIKIRNLMAQQKSLLTYYALAERALLIFTVYLLVIGTNNCLFISIGINSTASTEI